MKKPFVSEVIAGFFMLLSSSGRCVCYFFIIISRLEYQFKNLTRKRKLGESPNKLGLTLGGTEKQGISVFLMSKIKLKREKTWINPW